MPTFLFNKLIRDKLPERYDALGQTIIFQKFTGKALLVALREKLVEEAAEIPVDSVDREDIISEIADVEQVLDDMKRQLNITDGEVDKTKQHKFNKKGGFREGIFVKSIALQDDDVEWTEYYRREPQKYREIDSLDHANPDIESIEKGTYKHTKSGKLYEVIGTALQTETNDALVIYRPLYDHKYEFFARSHEMFIQMVNVNGKQQPRFEKVEDLL